MSKRARADDTLEAEVSHAMQVIRGCPPGKGDAVGVSLTPLERQVVALKESLPTHVILLVACGYRVKFYGRDSRVISRRSGIMCIPAQPFEYSSVPYIKVDLYVHRLVAMGYHVAFADQESAAVRAADGAKGGIFQRTISQVYSRGTLLPGERIATSGSDAAKPAEGEEAEEGDSANAWGAGAGPEGEVSELFVCFLDAASYSSAESTPSLAVVFVSFVTHRREVHMVHSALALEDLLQRHDVVEVIVVSPRSMPDSAAYLGLLPEKYTAVLEGTLSLNRGPTANGEEDGKCVSVCGCVKAPTSSSSLDETITSYLKPYKLDTVYKQMIQRSEVSSVVAPQHTTTQQVTMTSSFTLPGSTLRALDIFYSTSGPSGSLLNLLDSSITACGARKLRLWLTTPLGHLSGILERQAAVAFIISCGGDGPIEDMLRECARVGDAEAIVSKIHAQRCAVLEYTRLLRMTRCVFALAAELISEGSLPVLVERLLSRVSDKCVSEFLAAHTAEMESTAVTPLELLTAGGAKQQVEASLLVHMEERDRATSALDAELENIRQVLKLPGLEYRSIAGTPFVVDIPSGKVDRVPPNWLVLSRTKTNVRYHTPAIVEANIALCAAKERLGAAAQDVWRERQASLSRNMAHLSVITDVIDAVATLDSLRSIAALSARCGYVAPRMVEQPCGEDISICGGRHPMLDQRLGPAYVSCDVRLRAGGAWLLTGPNMGGKSALMRMVGCLVVLAQIGCYVPAQSATLPVFQGLYCRMGSSDSILEGRSTFFSEMEETSRILRAADLPQSLVLMDELGRGTSSFDGVAVADATLRYLLDRGATCVFVTHYNYICEPFAGGAADDGVECYYMGFRKDDLPSQDGSGDEKRLVFTYNPVKGITPSSFGVDVAVLAGLPANVTEKAREISVREEREQTRRIAVSSVLNFMR